MSKPRKFSIPGKNNRITPNNSVQRAEGFAEPQSGVFYAGSFNTGFPAEILGVESRKRFESPRHPYGVSGWEPTAPILHDSVCFTSDEIPLSYCMKKIINRNNLYQELLDDRNARFWYSIYYIKTE